MKPPAIAQQITFIYTTDLVESARFYEEIMGFVLWLDQISCRIYQVSSDGYIGICQTDDSSRGANTEGLPNNVVLTIVTPQVDEWYQYLNAHGIEFEKAPEYNLRYNIYHCFLRDPSGYLIEIQRFESSYRCVQTRPE